MPWVANVLITLSLLLISKISVDIDAVKRVRCGGYPSSFLQVSDEVIQTRRLMTDEASSVCSIKIDWLASSSRVPQSRLSTSFRNCRWHFSPVSTRRCPAVYRIWRRCRPGRKEDPVYLDPLPRTCRPRMSSMLFSKYNIFRSSIDFFLLFDFFLCRLQACCRC